MWLKASASTRHLVRPAVGVVDPRVQVAGVDARGDGGHATQRRWTARVPISERRQQGADERQDRPRG